MNRVGLTWRVNAEDWEAYRSIHLEPWPELLAAIQEHGMHNYSIFAMPPEGEDGARRVFAYMEIEGDDPNVVLDALGETDIKKKWDEAVTVWVMPDAVEGVEGQFLPLERIFFCP
jgi:L-rhamnose mutarotase